MRLSPYVCLAREAREDTVPPGNRLTEVVRCHVGAGNQTQTFARAPSEPSSSPRMNSSCLTHFLKASATHGSSGAASHPDGTPDRQADSLDLDWLGVGWGVTPRLKRLK